MTRYARQRDETSCGPVAIINIFKWMGHKTSYNDLIHSTRGLCKWEPGTGGGTTNIDQEKAMSSLNIKKKRRIKPSIKEIDNHLDRGGAILFGYYIPYSVPGFKKGDSHFALCIKRTKHFYTMVNDGTKRAVGRRSRKMMRKMLHGAWDNTCWVWLISKD